MQTQSTNKGSLLDESLLLPEPTQPVNAGFSTGGIDNKPILGNNLLLPPTDAATPLSPPTRPVTALTPPQHIIPPLDDSLVIQDPYLTSLGQDKALPQSAWKDISLTDSLLGNTNVGTGGALQAIGSITPGSMVESSRKLLENKLPVVSLIGRLVDIGTDKLLGRDSETSQRDLKLATAKLLLSQSSLLPEGKASPEQAQQAKDLENIVWTLGQEAETRRIKGIDKSLGIERSAAYTNALIDAGKGIAESGRRQAQQAVPEGTTPSFAQDVVLSGTTSFAQAFPGMVAAYVTRGRSGKFNMNQALALPAGLSAGSAYVEAKQKGASEATAMTHASFTGMTEAIFDKFGFEPLKDITKPVIHTVLKSMALESGTEMGTTLLQEIESNAVLNKNTKARDVVYNMLVAGVSAAGVGAVTSAPIASIQKNQFNQIETTADNLATLGIQKQDIVKKKKDGTFELADKETFTNEDFQKAAYHDLSGVQLTDVSSPEARLVLAEKALQQNAIDKNTYNKIIAEEAQAFKYIKELQPVLANEQSKGLRGSRDVHLTDDTKFKRLDTEYVRNQAQQREQAIIKDAASNLVSLIPLEYKEVYRIRTRLEGILAANVDEALGLSPNSQDVMAHMQDLSQPFRADVHPFADLAVQPHERTNQPGVTLLPNRHTTADEHATEQKWLNAYKRIYAKYLPDAEIYLTSDSTRNYDAEGNAQVMKGIAGNMRKLGDNAYMVIINPQLHNIKDSKKGIIGNTLLHEMGHTFHEMYLDNLPEEAQRGVLVELLKNRDKNSTPDIAAKTLQALGEQNFVYMHSLAETFARASAGTLNQKEFPYLNRAGLDFGDAMDSFSDSMGFEHSPANVILSDVYQHAANEANFKRILTKLNRLLREAENKGIMNYNLGESGGLSGIVNNLPPDVLDSLPSDVQFGLDRFHRGHELLVNLTQIIKDNEHIPEMSEIGELAREMQQKTNHWQIAANSRLAEWRSLSKGQSDAMSKFLYDYTTKFKSKPTVEQMQILVDLYGLDTKTHRVANGIIEDMDSVINEMEKQVLDSHQKLLKEGQERAYQDAVEETKAQFAKMRDKPYFPLTRFGKRSVTMYAQDNINYQGKFYRKGSVIRFSTFEGSSETAKEFAEIQRKNAALIKTGKVRVQKSVLAEEEQVFLNMPAHFVRQVADKMQLSGEQKNSLDRFLSEISPAQSFAKHFNKRKALHGYSENAMRTYADYMARFSRHVAKLEYGDKLLGRINSMQEGLVQGSKLYPTVDTSKRQNLINYLKRWHDYMMNPTDEWAKLRSFGFVYHLGYLPKSAVLNLSQLGLTAYPALAAEFGDAAAIRELSRGMRLAIGKWKNGELPDNLQRALDWGIDAGFLDESDAAILSGAATGGLLNRMAAHSKSGRFLEGFVRHSSTMFHITETYGRRATFIAAYNLARKRGKTDAEARITARGVIDDTMFEYARWARPELLRGKKSAFFLFHQFSLNMTRFAFGGNAGWWRSLLVLGATAGLQGLPFAENLMDMFDWLYKKAFGDYSDVRSEARKYIQEVGANPDLAMHGASRYGPGLFNQLANGQAPYFDMSGSLSMGAPFPLITGAVDAVTGKKDITKAMADSSGALFSIPFKLVDSITSDSPDVMTRVGKVLPTAAAGLWNATLAASRGGIPDKYGSELVHFDTQNTTHIAELFGMATGFMPTRKSQAYELLMAQNKEAQYWQGIRVNLMAGFVFAQSQKDKEAMADVLKRIRQFNKDQPYGGFTIDQSSLKSAVSSGKLRQIMREQGLTRQEKLIPLYQQKLQQYPQLKYQADSQ